VDRHDRSKADHGERQRRRGGIGCLTRYMLAEGARQENIETIIRVHAELARACLLGGGISQVDRLMLLQSRVHRFLDGVDQPRGNA
jgi:hypothetical protein